MPPIKYYLCTSEEDCKQLYWGAFMFGCAAFHQHRKDGYWLETKALEELASRGFQLLITETGDDVPQVDNENLGRIWFTDGFMAGYRQRAYRMGLNGLEPRSELGPPETAR